MCFVLGKDYILSIAHLKKAMQQTCFVIFMLGSYHNLQRGGPSIFLPCTSKEDCAGKNVAPTLRPPLTY